MSKSIRPIPRGLRAYWVQPGCLMAGEHPTLGVSPPLDPHADSALGVDMIRVRLAALLRAGVGTFIDLTEESPGRGYADALVELDPAARYERRPIPDFEVPDTVQMRAILDRIDAGLQAGEIIYVHCMAGQGRTGTVIGCWLARHGTTGASALEAIRRLRGDDAWSPETPEQRRMVREWPQGR